MELSSSKKTISIAERAMYGLYIALSFLSSNDWIYVKIRVDNVANDVSDAELRMLFEVFGKVQSVQLNERQNWAAVEM